MSRHSHNAPGSSAETAGRGLFRGKEDPAAGIEKKESVSRAEEEVSGAGEAQTAEPSVGTEGAAGGGEAVKEAENPKPEEQIAELKARLAEATDQYLRKAADYENFRKRMVREKQEAIDYANQNLLVDLIQIMDDFERAIKAAEATASASAEFTGFVEGVSMIFKQFSSLLENKWGLKRFESAGQPFDPNRHEAMMMEKSADVSEPVVKEEYAKGYTLKGRVVRSARVVVIMPDNSPAASSGQGSSQAEPAAGTIDI